MGNNCHKIHQIFNATPHFHFPFDEKSIPENGIYILFEKGEKAHDGKRIVRVGTHTGKDQLRSRLRQHFLVENKDRSIFRKNIGRALLNKNNDPYLEVWELDLTPREAKERYSHLIDVEKQRGIEKDVTKYLQDNFSFAVFEITDKDDRLALESKIISTISSCPDCQPSKNWLGLYSPKEKIRKSGLWLVNELFKQPLDNKDIQLLNMAVKYGK